MTQHTTLPTPVGDLTLLTHGSALLAAGWATPEELHERLQRRPGGAAGPLVPGADPVVVEAVQAYLAGDLAAADAVRVEQRGTAHQERVWKALREIPAGETVSYGELAAVVGTASRALGTACGANLVAPVVPCHRVVRSDGSLGGYYYGLAVKEWLLAHERSS